MEVKKVKIVLNKSGNGNITPRCPIPVEWFRKMGLSENELDVEIKFVEETGEFVVKKVI